MDRRCPQRGNCATTSMSSATGAKAAISGLFKKYGAKVTVTILEKTIRKVLLTLIVAAAGHFIIRSIAQAVVNVFDPGICLATKIDGFD